ncbi:thiamine pyrophosphate-dependent enzyme [Mycolicibacterium sp. XJ1819]
MAQRTIAVFGVGCYLSLGPAFDIEILQALHGRAPSVATGVKRVHTDRLVFTVQGDGDMVNEGLQEVIHTAARGESVTCILLNNGVFGETGGHMTSTTVLGQRTKNTLDGRDSAAHGYPIGLAEMLAPLQGVAFVARGAVNNPVNITKTRRILKRAFQSQIAGQGFSLVEILTMCPTGWFTEPVDATDYLDSSLAATHKLGVLREHSR